SARLLLPLRTPIHSSIHPACNNTVILLPATCPAHGRPLQVFAHATNADFPAAAVEVQLNSTPVVDPQYPYNRYVVLNGLTLPGIGRWRVTIWGEVEGLGEVFQVDAGTVNVVLSWLDVGRGPWLCKS
ncbi:hypothetical protein B0T20DRAFT_487670, partial [Sordaria brevicollis]